MASVQLQDDCPPPKRETPAASMRPRSRAEPAAQHKGQNVAAPGVVRGRRRACTQSRVQLSIESDDDQAQSLAIRAVRLKKADGGQLLGTMTTRDPTLWRGSKYEPWDETIAPGASIKVGYALGDPGWAAVATALGSETWATMYIVELDVEIDGRMQTVVSPKVPRDEPENIVT